MKNWLVSGGAPPISLSWSVKDIVEGIVGPVSSTRDDRTAGGVVWVEVSADI